MSKPNQTQIKAYLRQDESMATLINTLELPDLVSDGDVYLSLTRSIVSQQLSVKAASTIYGRFLDLFDNRYPNRQAVLNYSIDELRAVGLSRQKASYIQNVATFFETHEKDSRTDWSTMSDEAIIAYLTPIKGVGKWTVEMILMFTLHRLDVLPLDDLAIRNRMIQLYNVQETGRQLKPALTKIAAAWRPYRSVACRYLWLWTDNG